MRIGIDAHRAAQIERHSMPAPVEIEAPRIRIDLDCNIMIGTGSKYAGECLPRSLGVAAAADQSYGPKWSCKDYRPREGCAQSGARDRA
jgi:hypothetical protein